MFIFVPSFLLWVLLAIIVGFMGKKRKFGFWGYMLFSLFLSPLIGILLVLASDKKATAS